MVGFLGRKDDGPPSVKVLWCGWTRLQDIVSTFTLFTPSQDVQPAWRGDVSEVSRGEVGVHKTSVYQVYNRLELVLMNGL